MKIMKKSMNVFLNKVTIVRREFARNAKEEMNVKNVRFFMEYAWNAMKSTVYITMSASSPVQLDL